MNEAGQGGKPAAIRTTGEAGDEARTHDPGRSRTPCGASGVRTAEQLSFRRYACDTPTRDPRTPTASIHSRWPLRPGRLPPPGHGGPPQCLHASAATASRTATNSSRARVCAARPPTESRSESPAEPAGSRLLISQPARGVWAANPVAAFLRRKRRQESCRPSYFTSATTIAAPMTVSTQGPLHGSTVESWSRPAVVARSDPPRPRA